MILLSPLYTMNNTYSKNVVVLDGTWRQSSRSSGCWFREVNGEVRSLKHQRETPLPARTGELFIHRAWGFHVLSTVRYI